MRWILLMACVAFAATSANAQTRLRMGVGTDLVVSGYRTMNAALGGGSTTSVTRTVAGPTSGVQCTTKATGGTALAWISPPLAAPVTISGTVTLNTWARESATTANTGLQVTVHQYTTSEQAAFLNSERGSELTTSISNQTWTATPTSTTFARGDRIVVKWLVNDAGGTMASGANITLDYNGTTAGADGETYVEFAETLSFQAADVAFVQTASTDFGATSSGGLAFGLGTITGNLIVIGINVNSQSLTVSSVTDTNGNTYASAVGPTNWAGTSYRQFLYYAQNVTGGATPLTVTVTMSGVVPTYFEVFYHEYGGIAATNALVATAAATTTSPTTAVDSGSATTPLANDLVFGFIMSAAAIVSPGSGFTARSTFNSNLTEDKYLSTAGSTSVTATGDGNDTCAQMAVFRAANQPRRVIIVE